MAICLKSEVQEVDISKGGNGFGTASIHLFIETT
jgi:hypothetical protein